MAVSASISCFAAAFSGHAHLPGSGEYENMVSQHWAGNTVLGPSCIYSPNDAQHLAAALEYIAHNRIRFQIRGGGHNTNTGWASIDAGGILITTSSLKGIELIDRDGERALRVGAGVRFADVYEYLQDTGLTIAGGNQATPGLSGFYLGGGVGPYWNRCGYSVNTVLDFELVLAHGSMTIASADQNTDLFWALKTGLSNYGVVTRMVLKTFPVQNVIAGAHILPPTSYQDAFVALQRFTDDHGSSHNAVASLLSPAKGSVMVNLFYDGPHEDASTLPKEFEAFEGLTKVKSTAAVTNWVDIAKSSAAILPNGMRRYWSMLTIYHDLPLVSRLFDHYHSSADEQLASVQAGPFMILALPQSASGMQHNRSGPWVDDEPERDVISILLLPTWKHAADDESIKLWTEAVTDELRKLAKEAGKLHEFVYVNDANETQDALGSLGSRVLERLRDVSRTYDPDGVFQKLRTGGPKLW